MVLTVNAATKSRARPAPLLDSAADGVEPTAAAQDILERVQAEALDALVSTSAIVRDALEQHPEIRDEARRNPDIVRLIVEYCIAEFDAKLGRAVDTVRAEFAGDRVKLARRTARDRERLAADVLRLFDGRNPAEVARRLNIGRATVYRIVKQARRR